ncbi:MAG: hypothetical protein KME64_38770 [Scytonematopsis contorta HA4267-MV1]|jgi:hypothetical protein|nr:hypothetical protein [Scytonematopsis contorta HA4267-MV1]
MDSNQRIDYLYKEYTRLSEKAEEQIKSTYDDFKLLGVFGVFIVIWKPISDLIASTNAKVDSSTILFLGFFSVLIISGMIGFLDLIKQFYAWYIVYNLQAYEVEIKKELDEAENSQIFNFNLGKKEEKFIALTYRGAYRLLVITFEFGITIIPFLVLYHSSVLYAVIYLLISLSGFIIYSLMFQKMMKRYFNIKYTKKTNP